MVWRIQENHSQIAWVASVTICRCSQTLTKPLWHAAEVKFLWTQIYMRMPKYIWTSMLIFFEIFNVGPPHMWGPTQYHSQIARVISIARYTVFVAVCKHRQNFLDARWKWNFFEHSCAWECQSMYEPVFLEIFQGFTHIWRAQLNIYYILLQTRNWNGSENHYVSRSTYLNYIYIIIKTYLTFST